jgi:hypothetical protein
VTAPDAPGLRELGIDADDAALIEAASKEPEIAAEVSERQARARAQRRRAGPLPPRERAVLAAEAVDLLTRATLSLLVACDTPSEVDGALARAGLELRRAGPNPDHLAGWLRGRIRE